MTKARSEDGIEDVLHGQLDEVKALVNWVIGVAFIAIVLAVQGKPELGILGLQLSRSNAFFVLGAAYVALSLAVLGHTRRLAVLLQMIPNDRLVSHFDHIARHKWLFNPFASYCLEQQPRYPAALGFAGLVVTFWVCASSLVVLAPPRFLQSPLARLWGKSPLGTEFWVILGDVVLYLLPLGAFMMLGRLAMEVLLGTYSAADAALVDSEPEAAARLRTRREDLRKAADLGIALGGLPFLVALVLANLPRM